MLALFSHHWPGRAPRRHRGRESFWKDRGCAAGHVVGEIFPRAGSGIEIGKNVDQIARAQAENGVPNSCHEIMLLDCFQHVILGILANMEQVARLYGFLRRAERQQKKKTTMTTATTTY